MKKLSIPYCMKSYPVIFILALLFASTNTLAWTSDTHRWICNHAELTDLDCANADIPAVQKNYSGLGFVNHHCANNESDCAARKTAIKFQAMNSTITNGFAAHLYADSMVPVHWYSLDYYSCHKIFEDRVENEIAYAGNTKYILFGQQFRDATQWSFTQECSDKDGTIHELSASNTYMDGVVNYVAEKMGTTPQKTQSAIIDLTPIAITVMVIAVMLFILLFVFGRKNLKKKI